MCWPVTFDRSFTAFQSSTELSHGCTVTYGWLGFGHERSRLIHLRPVATCVIIVPEGDFVDDAHEIAEADCIGVTIQLDGTLCGRQELRVAG